MDDKDKQTMKTTSSSAKIDYLYHEFSWQITPCITASWLYRAYKCT